MNENVINFDPLKLGKFTVISGPDIALRDSLFQEVKANIVEFSEQNIQSIYSASLFENDSIKLFVSLQELQQIDLSRCCRPKYVFITDSLPTKKSQNTTYISCKNLKGQDKRAFIQTQSQRLMYKFAKISDLYWVENLFDLHFANKLNQLIQNANLFTQYFSKWDVPYSNTAYLKLLNTVDSWMWLKYYQKRNENTKHWIQYLELWARDYVPNDEVLRWMIQNTMDRIHELCQ